MSISIIVPVFNEEKNIERVIDELKQTLPQAEIIVVDDGSTDNSFKIAQKKEIKLIRHDFNKGYGSAIKTGIKKAQNEIIGIIDGDGTYSAGDFPKLLEYINKYDMVVGVREKKGIPIIRRPAKWFLHKLANYLVGYKIPDLNSGLRIFRKETVKRFQNILSSGFSFTTTLTLAMFSENMEIKYVPISYCKRKEEKSKIHPIKDTLNFFQLIIKTIMYFCPLKIFLPVSLLLLFIGIASSIRDVFIGGTLQEIDIIIILIAILIGAVGFLADLIVAQHKKS